jgi:integrase
MSSTLINFSADLNLRGVMAMPTSKVKYAPMDLPRYAKTLHSALALGRSRFCEGGKQACLVIQKEFIDYLAALPPGLERSVYDVTPADIVIYMQGHWVPNHGRTYLPNGEIVPSFSYFKNCLSFLRRLFDDAMREGVWNPQDLSGNPGDSGTVKAYRSGFERKLWRAGVEAIAAAVLTEEQFQLLCDYLIGELDSAISSGASPMAIALIFRDLMLITFLWQIGQRGGEGARLRINDLDRTEGASGVCPNGLKTRQRQDHGVFIPLKKADNEKYCFLKLLDPYIAVLARAGVNVSGNFYLFPMANVRRTGFEDDPLTGPAAYNRLRVHLEASGVDQGQSLHSFKRAKLQGLKRKGVPLGEILVQGTHASERTSRAYTNETRPTRKAGQRVAKRARTARSI